jgi:hypothetical protein
MREMHAQIQTAVQEKTPMVMDRFKSKSARSLTNLIAQYGPHVDSINAKNSNYPEWERIRPMVEQLTPGAPYTLNAQKLHKGAEDYAKALEKAWTDKLTHKLRNVERVEVHNVTGDGFVVTGFTPDGTKVHIDQNAILNFRGNNGFWQFPARITLGGKSVSEAEYHRFLKTENLS